MFFFLKKKVIFHHYIIAHITKLSKPKFEQRHLSVTINKFSDITDFVTVCMDISNRAIKSESIYIVACVETNEGRAGQFRSKSELTQFNSNQYIDR